MANTLGAYDPLFYAQEGLIQLEKQLGMAARVHRGYDKDPQEKGSTIQIRKPSTFTAQDAPSSAQDLNTSTVSIALSNWREVKFALTDKELNATQEQIIADHIRPAAVTLADDIDQKLCALYKDVPWYYDLNATTEVADLTGTRRILFDNQVPMDEERLHYMVDGAFEEGLLGLSAFTQWQGSGQVGAEAQLRGQLGKRFGMNIFANQNVPSHVKGTASTGTLALDGGGSPVAAGTSTITLDAGAVTGTLVPGDTFVIAGSTQRYAVTNTVTAAANAFVGVTITPALAIEYADNAVVTVSLDDHVANLAFHRNAFALAMAPLVDAPLREFGVRVETISDPKTNLALRSRIFYVGDSSKLVVALDVLYGVKTLDPNLAVRGRG